MSFPRLVLDGDVSTNSLSGISLEYPNSLSGQILNTGLTRSKYDVQRQFRTGNISSATPTRYPDTPYDEVRYVHKWVGYCDVTTDSVAVTPDASLQTLKNVALIKTSVILNDVNGIQFTVPTFSDTISLQGPSNPSLTHTYVQAKEQGVSWTYDGPTDLQTIFWVIKDISIQDNANNTSRVTFVFELVEPWIYLPTTLTVLTD